LSNSKKKYISFTTDYYVPVFYQPWYLDAVCDSPWDVVIYEEDGEILGVLVFMIKAKYGLTYILHPPFCPYMGPMFFGSQDLNSVFDSLIDRLPRHHVMIQDFYHSTPEIKNNQLIKEKYTYIIDKDDDVNILKSKLSSDRRRKIRKAAERFELQIEESISVFQDFLDQSFSNRGKKNPYADIPLESIDRQLVKHHARRIIKCIDNRGKIMAMGYFLVDEKWVFNIATGVDNSYPHEAMSLMVWSEIEKTLNSGRSFDFEGSNIPGVESFYKSFKGEKVYYQSYYRSKNKFLDLLVKIKNPEIHRS
jgi:hypothetical protein